MHRPSRGLTDQSQRPSHTESLLAMAPAAVVGSCSSFGAASGCRATFRPEKGVVGVKLLGMVVKVCLVAFALVARGFAALQVQIYIEQSSYTTRKVSASCVMHERTCHSFHAIGGNCQSDSNCSNCVQCSTASKASVAVLCILHDIALPCSSIDLQSLCERRKGVHGLCALLRG